MLTWLSSLNEDILVVIIKNSDVLTLGTWRYTCRGFYTVVGTVLRKRYESCIQPFVLDVNHFDNIVRACGAVISGSVALQFFLHDDPWHPSDLDIYLPDRTFDSFVNMVDKDPKVGFQILPNSEQPQRGSAALGYQGIRNVYRFRTKTDRFVDVIRSSMNSPVTPLHAFWSTLVMNFVTPDGCVCGFPEGTLNRQGIVRGTLTTERDQSAVTKIAGLPSSAVPGRVASTIPLRGMWITSVTRMRSL